MQLNERYAEIKEDIKDHCGNNYYINELELIRKWGLNCFLEELEKYMKLKSCDKVKWICFMNNYENNRLYATIDMFLEKSKVWNDFEELKNHYLNGSVGFIDRYKFFELFDNKKFFELYHGGILEYDHERGE